MKRNMFVVPASPAFKNGIVSIHGSGYTGPKNVRTNRNDSDTIDETDLVGSKENDGKQSDVSLPDYVDLTMDISDSPTERGRKRHHDHSVIDLTNSLLHRSQATDNVYKKNSGAVRTFFLDQLVNESTLGDTERHSRHATDESKMDDLVQSLYKELTEAPPVSTASVFVGDKGEEVRVHRLDAIHVSDDEEYMSSPGEQSFEEYPLVTVTSELTQETSFACEFCSAFYSTVSELSHHVLISHKKEGRGRRHGSPLTVDMERITEPMMKEPAVTESANNLACAVKISIPSLENDASNTQEVIEIQDVESTHEAVLIPDPVCEKEPKIVPVGKSQLESRPRKDVDVYTSELRRREENDHGNFKHDGKSTFRKVAPQSQLKVNSNKLQKSEGSVPPIRPGSRLPTTNKGPGKINRPAKEVLLIRRNSCPGEQKRNSPNNAPSFLRKSQSVSAPIILKRKRPATTEPQKLRATELDEVQRAIDYISFMTKRRCRPSHEEPVSTSRVETPATNKAVLVPISRGETTPTNKAALVPISNGEPPPKYKTGQVPTLRREPISSNGTDQVPTSSAEPESPTKAKPISTSKAGPLSRQKADNVSICRAEPISTKRTVPISTSKALPLKGKSSLPNNSTASGNTLHEPAAHSWDEFMSMKNKTKKQKQSSTVREVIFCPDARSLMVAVEKKINSWKNGTPATIKILPKQLQDAKINAKLNQKSTEPGTKGASGNAQNSDNMPVQGSVAILQKETTMSEEASQMMPLVDSNQSANTSCQKKDISSSVSHHSKHVQSSILGNNSRPIQELNSQRPSGDFYQPLRDLSHKSKQIAQRTTTVSVSKVSTPGQIFTRQPRKLLPAMSRSDSSDLKQTQSNMSQGMFPTSQVLSSVPRTNPQSTQGVNKLTPEILIGQPQVLMIQNTQGIRTSTHVTASTTQNPLMCNTIPLSTSKVQGSPLSTPAQRVTAAEHVKLVPVMSSSHSSDPKKSQSNTIPVHPSSQAQAAVPRTSVQPIQIVNKLVPTILTSQSQALMIQNTQGIRTSTQASASAIQNPLICTQSISQQPTIINIPMIGNSPSTAVLSQGAWNTTGPSKLLMTNVPAQQLGVLPTPLTNRIVKPVQNTLAVTNTLPFLHSNNILSSSAPILYTFTSSSK